MKLLWEVKKGKINFCFANFNNFSFSSFFCFCCSTQIINGKYVEGFNIYARNVFDSSPDNKEQTSLYKMLTILNAGSGVSSCQISGLQKFTTYEFFIVPFYKAVEGKPSNSRIARTLEDGETLLSRSVESISLNFRLLLFRTVPSEAPFGMEAKLLNASTVYVKWKAPAAKHHNGVLKSYSVIVRGVNVYENISKVLTNISIDSSSSSIMLANLTEGVTYTVSVAAVNGMGAGPYSQPAILRLDPVTKQLDTSFTYRFPLNNEHMDDFATKPRFIILLGTILVIVMLAFGVMVFLKRKHLMMKQSVLGLPASLTTVKIPPANNYWMDPAGTIWKSNARLKDGHIPDYAPVCTAMPPTAVAVNVDSDSRNR